MIMTMSVKDDLTDQKDLKRLNDSPKDPIISGDVGLYDQRVNPRTRRRSEKFLF